MVELDEKRIQDDFCDSHGPEMLIVQLPQCFKPEPCGLTTVLHSVQDIIDCAWKEEVKEGQVVIKALRDDEPMSEATAIRVSMGFWLCLTKIDEAICAFIFVGPKKGEERPNQSK